jgi:hypothetical protein
MADQNGETLLIEDDEDKAKKAKSEEVEFVPVESKDEDDHDDDQDDSEDARLSEDNEDREELRRKRREEKKERAERRKEAIARDKKELEFLRQRNEALEKRVMAVEKSTATTALQTVDARIQETVAEVRAAERIMARAIEAGNGDDAAKALKIRDEAMHKVQQLQMMKHQQTQQVQEIQKRADNPGPDPEVARLAADWAARNTWYDHKAKTEESKIVLAIDQTLVEQGYNPRTEEYWQELDKRVANRLPHLKGGGHDDDGSSRSGRKGPPVGSGRDHTPPSSRQQVYISPERKQAMIDAGVWEDPVLRQRYLKQYAKWDRDHSTNSSR